MVTHIGSSSRTRLASGLAVILLVHVSVLPVSAAGSPIDFDRDVRPILSDKCFRCHGPDENQRQADLRLDEREDVFQDLGGYAVVVSGQPDESELVRRVFAEDPDEKMPPPDAQLQLTQREREVLHQWVREGASWSNHWSFVPPVKPELPKVPDVAWSVNPIDRFIFARLQNAGLAPSRPADRERLLQRVTIDLTGLPPTIAEIDAFLEDDSPEAYRRVVDRLLQSSACAERLALDWMDLARYADSHGLHADGWRRMWPWRDWVIQAFRENLPYDEFVTWQIAGDLLPNAQRPQRLATAFHRNHPMTAEGGVIDEEFRLLYVFDRVETTATAFLGLTIQCARCHDHKFDPIQQREYYELAAFYNNVRELGMTGDDGNYGPLMLLPTSEDEVRLADLDRRISDAQQALEAIRAAARAEFEAAGRLDAPAVSIPKGARFPLETASQDADGDSWLLDENSDATTAIRPELIDAVDGRGVLVTNEYGYLSLQGVGHFDVADTFSAALWIRPDQALGDVNPAALRTILGTAGQKNQRWCGWEFDLDGRNRLVVRLIHALPGNLIDVRTEAPIPVGEWSHVAFTYDGSGRASGIRCYVDGAAVAMQVADDELTRSIFPVQHAVGFPADEKRSVRAGRSYRAFTGEFGIFAGAMDDIRMWESCLTAMELAELVRAYPRSRVRGVEAEDQGLAETEILQHWLRRHHQDYVAAEGELRSLRAERIRIRSEIPEIMVMAEMPQARETFVLHRGEYDRPLERVAPGTPDAVLAFPPELPTNRLGLAQWLFHMDNSLTARVAVNHYWQLIFGDGLVRTPHDFGVQGERPTHPQLLDWLAVRFRDSGWDIRQLLRGMVLSETYRQSSAQRPDLAERDPENRLLGRSPSYRLPAEIIRDRALAAGGLLVRQVGGPSVKPYQPEGLWIEKNNFSQYLLKYEADKGEKLYRRSLYTFIRRTSPPPAMIALDAPNRSVCTVKREVTNTPLQALVLMNDPQFVEAARALAVRLQRECNADFDERLAYAFRLVTGRRPRREEVPVFRELFESRLRYFQQHADEASSLLQVGDFDHDSRFDSAVTAAWSIVSNTLMNFDEFYMKR